MKVYTKTGDKGETGLVGGSRVSKADIRLETYGEVDELNSQLGMLRSFLAREKGDFGVETQILKETQSALFTLGSNLASEKASREKFKLPNLGSNLIKKLESEIDRLDEKLEPLKNFILPDGTMAASAAHIARSVCRRAERRFVAFSLELPGEAPENGLELLNRLSDYLFTLSRYINKTQGEEETVWKP